MRKIKVIIKEPGKKPRCVNISDTLENLQKTVDGYIETVSFATDFVVICDEEGRLKNKPYCCNICGVNFFRHGNTRRQKGRRVRGSAVLFRRREKVYRSRYV